MFLFRRRSSSQVSTEALLAFMGTDLHSHLLPAVDDGVQDVATSLEFIHALQQMGIRQIITTPHVMMDRFPNDLHTLSDPYQQVQAALREEGNTIPFRHAGEYYLDETLPQLLQQPLMKLFDQVVLVEMSFMSAPPQIFQWLFDLQAAGYQPLLAHPERYAYHHQHPESYARYRERGCMMQVNLLSLTGYYGKHIKQAAEYLLQKGWIDYIGTDLHHHKHLQAIRDMATNKKLRQTLEAYPFKNAAIPVTG
ncbi:tyrosine-protein phosphatase YwqE [Chitinophaga dinghuensis]|uniref:protein-tyrosine-phosphatase n=1 Tax=Chitinophaga dinghuensis TaxID=1539050 RepID=A0A327VSG2_9BACT|nr:CpsB/CapC family capsule biosynthesis tyrosine phosphatase [Chitinophaga dinghuensis]RAJ73523.1 tyrosine-protein phosphatase YwqE [Chitinophaga dinghuensis]